MPWPPRIFARSEMIRKISLQAYTHDTPRSLIYIYMKEKERRRRRPGYSIREKIVYAAFPGPKMKCRKVEKEKRKNNSNILARHSGIKMQTHL